MGKENLILLDFTKNLMTWYDQNGRKSLPWVGIKDPYKIWISEVILQQTRVLQGIQYYNRFINSYPDVSSLAIADEGHVLKLWEGLGYYSRGRNLLKTAIIVKEKYDGLFPHNYDEIIKLPGIGPYTAAAILSFAYEKPYPVLDGNVYRVISRITGDFFPIDHSRSRIYYLKKVSMALGKYKASKFNQAIMDFGAIQCTPKLPTCEDCIMSNICIARNESVVEKLPVKSKSLIKKHRYLNFIWLVDENLGSWIERRIQGDIWEGLYQPFFVETEEAIQNLSIVEEALAVKYGIGIDNITSQLVLKHTLTHQVLNIQIFLSSIGRNTKKHPANRSMIYCGRENITKYAFPKPLMDFVKKNF